MQRARRGGDLRKGAGLLHADVPAGLRLQRQDLPKRVRRAARQGPGRLHRTLQEAALDGNRAGTKASDEEKEEGSENGQLAGTHRDPRESEIDARLPTLSATACLTGVFPAGCCFQIIYSVSNLFFVPAVKPARTYKVKTAWLIHAVKNAWAFEVWIAM
jgi:hypothetical protein